MILITGRWFVNIDRSVELAVATLESDDIDHPDAMFNLQAPGNLRCEVACTDRDFMGRLGWTSARSDFKQ